MNYAQTEGRASFDDMTTTEIKKHLIAVMKENKGIHYTLGWLQSSYFHPQDEEMERAVAIQTLKDMGC